MEQLKKITAIIKEKVNNGDYTQSYLGKFVDVENQGWSDALLIMACGFLTAEFGCLRVAHMANLEGTVIKFFLIEREEDEVDCESEYEEPNNSEVL